MYREWMADGDHRIDKGRMPIIRQLFVAHGYSGHVWARDEEPDEAVFIIAAGALRSIRDRALSIALQGLVGRKVWVIEESEEWRRGARQLW
jgi:hypothetical protein